MTVAIIGAGITGLYLAWKLAEKGHQVTVFEKNEKIGKKACSGLLSERILDFIPQSQKLIQNQINYVLIHWPKRTLKVNFSKKFFVIERSELDQLVAKIAKKSGVRIILKHKAHKIKDDFEKIIGCDGASSQVRKSLGLSEPEFRLAIQGFIKKKDYSNFVETWPTKDGFIWKIPRGKEIEYGIIANPKKIITLFERFLQKNKLHLDSIKSAIIPQVPTAKTLLFGEGFLIIPFHPSITLCGEAAGLTKPWSGGGVIWGLIAANILLKNFPDFLKYRKAVKKFFVPKIISSKIATKAVYFFGNNLPWIFPKNIKIEGDFLF